MLDGERLDRAERWFAEYGGAMVLWARMVPLIRSGVAIPAGMARMPALRFTVLTTTGSATWNALLIGCGWALGTNWELVSEVLLGHGGRGVGRRSSGSGAILPDPQPEEPRPAGGWVGELARKARTVLAGTGVGAFVLYLRTLPPTVVP